MLHRICECRPTYLAEQRIWQKKILLCCSTKKFSGEIAVLWIRVASFKRKVTLSVLCCRTHAAHRTAEPGKSYEKKSNEASIDIEHVVFFVNNKTFIYLLTQRNLKAGDQNVVSMSCSS